MLGETTTRQNLHSFPGTKGLTLGHKPHQHVQSMPLWPVAPKCMGRAAASLIGVSVTGATQELKSAVWIQTGPFPPVRLLTAGLTQPLSISSSLPSSWRSSRCSWRHSISKCSSISWWHSIWRCKVKVRLMEKSAFFLPPPNCSSYVGPS